jgi:chromosome segregation ATPase
MDGLTLAEKSELLASQKENLEKLQTDRLEYYKEAKNFEEKMASLGLSEEKKKQIKDQIMVEGGEISSEIEKIRTEYGFKPTPIEVYSTRIKMLQNEVDRINENLNSEYRKILNHIQSEGFEQLVKHNDLATRSHHLKHLEHKLGKYPEVKTFVQSVKESKQEHYELDYNVFIAALKSQIEEGSKYKTEGEANEAQARIDKLNKLIGLNDSVLHDAMKKEGRFNKDNF